MQGPNRGGAEAPRAVIVTVGEELLLGHTLDTNAAWLGVRVSELGLRVTQRATVGDDEASIARALSWSLDNADLVLVTGGLGPTADDRTREGVAALLGVPLPGTARVLVNSRGSAPGLLLEARGARVALLPGVPREMKAIWEEALREELVGAFGSLLRPAWHRTLHTTGMAEAELALEIERLLPPERGPVEVAYLPDLGGVDLRFTARVSRAEAEGWFDTLEGALEPMLTGGYLRVTPAGLVEAVADALERAGLTLATAESCTGGLIAKLLTDRPGASGWFLGGFVAYADAVKVRELGVDRRLLAEHGAVSEAVARAMAEGVARAMGSGAALSVTGVAGPSGATQDKPVGLVWYAACVAGHTRAEVRTFPGDREAVREGAARAALALLLDAIGGSEADARGRA